MATWNSRGLRGSTLEEFINHSNERYSEMGLALMQKIPTPITPVRMDKDHRQITLAYFDKASTVPSHFRMYMSIRWTLWKSLNGRAGLPFF